MSTSPFDDASPSSITLYRQTTPFQFSRERLEGFAGDDGGDVAILDFDGDGLNDLAFGRFYGRFPEGADGDLRIYPQRPDRSFGPVQELPLGHVTLEGAAYQEVADVNNDRRQELVVIAYPPDESPFRLMVISGEAALLHDGGLPRADVTAGTSVADVNGNGGAALVVGGEAGVQALTSLAPGSGLAQLLGASVGAFAVADFDQDGTVDVAWAAPRDPSGGPLPGLQLSLRRSDGSSRTIPVPAVPAVSFGAAMAAGNLNNDGRPDLVVLRGLDFSDPEGVTFLAGDGAGGFTRIGGLAESGFQRIRLIDLDGDGDDDLVFDHNNNSTTVYQNRSAFGPTNGGNGGGGSQGGGPAIDRTAPKLSVGLHPRRRLKLGRSLRLTVKCNEACQVRVSPQLVVRAPGRKAKVYPLKLRAFDLAAGARRQLTVPIDRKRTVLARRGLARGAKVSLRVVLVVTDAAGNSAVTRRVVPLR